MGTRMKQYIFTFGFGHHHAGGSLSNHYTVIGAEDEFSARAIMHEQRGPKWAFSYDSREAAGVDRFELTFIHFDKVTKQNGENY